jgi:hypothetical protein
VRPAIRVAIDASVDQSEASKDGRSLRGCPASGFEVSPLRPIEGNRSHCRSRGREPTGPERQADERMSATKPVRRAASTLATESMDHAVNEFGQPIGFPLPDWRPPPHPPRDMRVMPSAGSIEVGHVNFSPALKRSAAATEAMYLMMESAFRLGYRRYEWKCDDLNAASRAAARRLGFSYEGTTRQATVYKGRSRDTAWYSIIDTEWPALRGAFEAWLDPGNFDSAGRQRSRLSDLTCVPNPRRVGH